MFALTIIWTMVGCNPHPEVTSVESMRLMQALYTACSSSSTDRIDQVESELRKLVDQQKLSDAEKASFEAIIATARRGDWESAKSESYRFAQAQVR